MKSDRSWQLATELPLTWRPRRASRIGGTLPLPPDAEEVEVPADPDVRQAAFGSENGIVLLARTRPERGGDLVADVSAGDAPAVSEGAESRDAGCVAGATVYVTRSLLPWTPGAPLDGKGPDPLYVGTVDVLLPDGSSIFATAMGPTQQGREQLLAAITQLRLEP